MAQMLVLRRHSWFLFVRLLPASMPFSDTQSVSNPSLPPTKPFVNVVQLGANVDTQDWTKLWAPTLSTEGIEDTSRAKHLFDSEDSIQ